MVWGWGMGWWFCRHLLTFKNTTSPFIVSSYLDLGHFTAVVIFPKIPEVPLFSEINLSFFWLCLQRSPNKTLITCSSSRVCRKRQTSLQPRNQFRRKFGGHNIMGKTTTAGKKEREIDSSSLPTPIQIKNHPTTTLKGD